MLNCLTCSNIDHKAHTVQLDLEVKLLRGDSVELDFVMGTGGSNTQSPPSMRHLFLETRANAARARARGTPNGVNRSITDCELLGKCGCRNEKDEFLGRLPSLRDDRQQHLIYHHSDHCEKQKSLCSSGDELTIYEMLEKSPAWFGEPEDQHLLAYKLASSVLHLHATPWLSDTWQLHNISLLDQADFDDDGLPNALRTLHVTLDIPPTTAHHQSNTPVQTSRIDNDLEIYQQFGVRNIVLFNLGAALLEIEHRDAIANLKEKPRRILLPLEGWSHSLSLR